MRKRSPHASTTSPALAVLVFDDRSTLLSFVVTKDERSPNWRQRRCTTSWADARRAASGGGSDRQRTGHEVKARAEAGHPRVDPPWMSRLTIDLGSTLLVERSAALRRLISYLGSRSIGMHRSLPCDTGARNGGAQPSDHRLMGLAHENVGQRRYVSNHSMTLLYTASACVLSYRGPVLLKNA